ncbi:ATP-binding protein [Candidatus Nitrosocosmicus sp. FF01]|uniref:sensor histidine kinase n=1 Tax=Candidatus Nitrosocosmicus sp. FF01 TaxID=3397670 RepID=UPI0039EA2D89
MKIGAVRSFFTANKSVIIVAILIVIIPISLYLYFQQETESSIRNSIYEQQKQNQMDASKAIATHLESDIELILSRLQGLASSPSIMNWDTRSNTTITLLKDYYRIINSSTPVDRLFLNDRSGVSVLDIAPLNTTNYAGINFSFRDWVNQTKNTLSPVISDTFLGMDDKNRIAMTYPIIIKNSSGSFYNGLVGVVIPVNEFFNFYGNIYDIQSQYLSVLDNKSVILVHPLPSLVGKEFFGEFTQNLTGYNDILNNLVRTVISGQPNISIYEFVNEERLNTGYPVYIDGVPKYAVFVVTPTSSIYSTVNNIIEKERLQMLSLIIGIIAAVLLLILYLSKVNSTLDKAVKKRTTELENVNIKLESANKHIKIHDDMQKEFINMAAHELRNPVQSLLGFSDILKKLNIRNEGNKIALQYKDAIEAISRSSKRLKRLVDIIFDVSQLDNNLLILNKESFDLKDMIEQLVTDYQSHNTLLNNTNNNQSHIEGNNIEYTKGKHVIDFAYSNYPPGPKTVKGDKAYLKQVITNLVDNAVEFTQNEGKVKINLDKELKNGKVIVTVSDNGYGIHPDILPFLFTKYVKKSRGGAGLSLYISKKIIEAHGGEIWAKNNDDGRGATFGFSLPLDK